MKNCFKKIWQTFQRKKIIFVSRHPIVRKIAFKLDLAIFLISIVPLLVASYLIFFYVKADLRSQIIESQVLIAEAQEGHVLSFLESLRRETLDLTYDALISRSLEKIVYNKPGASQAARELNTYLSFIKTTFNDRVYGINIIDKNGLVVASTDEREIGRDERQDDYFLQSIGLDYGKTFLSDIVVGHHFVEGRNPFLIIASPLVGEKDGKVIGVVAKYFKTHYLNDLLSGEYQKVLGAISGMLGRNDTLDIYLVNKNKLLISKSRFLGAEAFLTQVVDTDPVRACLSGQREISGIWDNYLGDKTLGSAMCLPKMGWTLVVEKHENEAFQLIALLTRNLNSFIFLMSALVTMLGIYIAQQIARPITSLSRVAQKVSSGDLSVRAHVNSADEIGVLGRSFNEMLDKLDAANAALMLEKNKLGIILDSLPVAVDIVDEQRNIVYSNHVFKKLFGDCVAGDKCYLKVKDNKQICPNCPLEEEIKKGKGVLTIEISDAGGGKVFEISHGVFKDILQKTLIVEVFLDITKKHEVERMKTEFVSLASHQLRTPLTAIKLFVEMLQSGDIGNLKETQKEYLKNIARSTDRMVTLVNELLNVSRLEAGRLSVVPKMLYVDEVIDGVIDEIKPLAKLKKCAISFLKPDERLAPVSADPNLLRQVILNLVQNAVVYSFPGKNKCNIEITLQQQASDIMITVADEGIGIPSKEQSRIFEKFFRASNAVRMEASNIGLGLYISKTILEGVGGKIWFESPVLEEETPEGKVRRGTKFYVTIPIAGMPAKSGEKELAG